MAMLEFLAAATGAGIVAANFVFMAHERRVLLGRFLSSVAMLTQSVTLGWQVYSIARLDHSIEYSSFLVGMIGLAQFVPMFAFVLLVGGLLVLVGLGIRAAVVHADRSQQQRMAAVAEA